MQSPYNVLVIGCGSIGAGYDLDTDAVQTHAKAFLLHPRTRLAVADNDPAKAAQVAERYGAEWVPELSDEALQRFDIVSVCVGTSQHFPFLERLIRLRIPLILCEKPIVGRLSEITALEQLLKQYPDAKILVNYIRRFQPGFALLQQRLTHILAKEPLRQVVVRYGRGLLNNGGHALDTLNYLVQDVGASLEQACLTSACYDAFPDDPTVSMQAKWLGVPISFLGFSDTHYSLFELDIYTSGHCITLTDSGNTIRYYKAGVLNTGLEEMNTLKQTAVLKDYMQPVAAAAINCLEGYTKTNFSTALEVNRQLLTILENHPQ